MTEIVEATHTESEATNGPHDIYLAYSEADRDVAESLRDALQQCGTNLKIWCERDQLDAGDCFNQTADEALAQASLVIAIWTPNSALKGGLGYEARRAITLRKPFINVLVEVAEEALPAPYDRYASFRLDEIARLADRERGWLPTPKPGLREIQVQLKPLVTKIAHLRAAVEPGNRELADQMIAQVSDAAGAPHDSGFEAMLKSMGPGDPATAIEVLLISGYREAEINTLLAPQKVQVADPSAPRPEWGAWKMVENEVAKVPIHRDNGALYAVGGFLAALMLAAIAWVMGSTLTSPSTNAPIQASNGPIRANVMRLPTEEAASDLADCVRGADGAITGAPCQLVENVTPLPPPRGTVESASPSLRTCERDADGRIANVPCQLDAPVASRAAPPPSAQPDEPEIASCGPLRSGSRLESGCRLDATVVLAHRTCDETLSNLPCTLESVPRRLTAGNPSSLADASAANATTTVPRPASPTRPIGGREVQVAASPVQLPANLEPCGSDSTPPCQFTVAGSGLRSLTEISEAYYGDKDAWCRIFRANPNTFSSRGDTRRARDPNCIFSNDVFGLPTPLANGATYSVSECPPAQTQNQCYLPSN